MDTTHKKESRPLQGTANASIHTINDNNLPEKRQVTIVGKPLRSLKLLKENKATGLTRAEALEKYGILSLTQHVHTLRHEYSIEIFTEWVNADETTKYGRYYLISNISFPSQENGGL